ncbi:hypothetical protein BH24ACT22_BH24ACT22_15240 [soil metagenome]
MRLAGISVDPPDHNATMREKLDLPFPLLSDARGELSKLCDLWNEDEGVAIPAIIVVDKSGGIRYAYSGSDFADRPGDDKIFGALDELSDSVETENREPEVSLSADEAQRDSVRPDKPPITLEQLIPYYRGVFFTTVALKKRLNANGAVESAGEVDSYQKLTNGYSEALNETRKLKSA